MDKHLRFAQGIIGFTILWSIAAVLLISLRHNLLQPWVEWIDARNTLYHRWIIIETIGMAIEVGLVVQATALVGFLAMTSKIKLIVMGIFSIRLL